MWRKNLLRDGTKVARLTVWEADMALFITEKEESTVETGTMDKCTAEELFTTQTDALPIKDSGAAILSADRESSTMNIPKG